MEAIKSIFKNYGFWLEQNPGKAKSLFTLAIIAGAVGWLINWPWLVIGAVLVGLPGIAAYVQRKFL